MGGKYGEREKGKKERWNKGRRVKKGEKNEVRKERNGGRKDLEKGRRERKKGM